ncbi:hypothetical protein CAEBREN_24089 [Caenorhabditis brenneri]|uniref:RecF/RecN/SMC N-terminal domain-containing protein n=1 Tax=Caenorhabditis brenneri TaxID=135651 RepID=G0MYA0_CAEBE|nr:hypothetical protein CAEBREN_24089 [Caenorhabditis brenneri]
MAQQLRADSILMIQVDHYKELPRKVYNVATPAFQFKGDDKSGKLLVEAIGFVLLRDEGDLHCKDITAELGLADGTRRAFRKKTTVRGGDEFYSDGRRCTKEEYAAQLKELHIEEKWCARKDWTTLAQDRATVLAEKFNGLRRDDGVLPIIYEFFGTSESEKDQRMLDDISKAFDFAFQVFYGAGSGAYLEPVNKKVPLKGLKVELFNETGNRINSMRAVGPSVARAASFALLFAINCYTKSPILVVDDLSSTDITHEMLKKLSEKAEMQIIGTGLPIAGVQSVDI